MNTKEIAKWASTHKGEIKDVAKTALWQYVSVKLVLDALGFGKRYSDWHHHPEDRRRSSTNHHWEETNRFQDPEDGSIWVRYQHQ